MPRNRQRKKSQNSTDSGGHKNKSTSQNNSSTKEQNGHAITANKSTQNGQQRTLRHVPSLATLNRIERDNLSLLKAPIRTIHYASAELIYLLYEFLLFLKKHKFLVFLASVLSILFFCAYKTPGPHQQYVEIAEKNVLWCVWWLWLGVMSSIGFGSGLHTFVLYLGPHIAKVTLAAFNCNSLNFPSPPYPDEIICPDNVSDYYGEITLWSIISKVRLEALMWGAGTALGELPPYFMARAARISGQEPDDEEYQEYLHFIQQNGNQQEMSFLERWKFKIEKLVVGAGFIGILLFASIPNPLFDLAGMICGHSLVSFSTFFGATLVGKALIKAHIQMFFVVLTFSEHHVENFIALVKNIPKIGETLQALLREYFNEQQRKLHRNSGDKISEQGSSLLQQILTVFISLMILRFVYEILNSFAKNYHKRVNRTSTTVTTTKKVK